MKMRVRQILIVAAAAGWLSAATSAQQTSHDHEAHHREMMTRGAVAMGFDQERTVHRFLLHDDGGAIDVAVTDANDQVNRLAVRRHLQDIAILFKAGDFAKPALTHAQQVPGTPVMARLKDHIAYQYGDTPGGGQLRITTRDAEALTAVHVFLRFQIDDHRTGDSGTVGSSGASHQVPGAGMMRGQGSTAMAEMQVIHELFMSHDRITRTVTNLPDGIRTETASTDLRVAALIQGHVARMGLLIDAGQDPNLPMESPALRTIFRNAATIRTTTVHTPQGVVVTQTSPDPETVRALQQHAAEVSVFVDRGMGAMHEAMMKNGGMMQHDPDDHAPAPR